MEPIHDAIRSAPLPIPISKDVNLKESKTANQEIEAAAEQFESMLALQLVQTMQKSLENGNMFGEGLTGDIYSGLTEWELARVLARNTDFGIKENILKQIGNREGSAHEVRSR